MCMKKKFGAMKRNPHPGTSFHYGSTPQAPPSLGEVLEKVVLGVGLCQPQVVLWVPPSKPRVVLGVALGHPPPTRLLETDTIRPSSSVANQ